MRSEFYGPAFGPNDDIRYQLKLQGVDVPDDFRFSTGSPKLEVPDIGDLIPDNYVYPENQDFPATIDGIRERFVPSGNVFNAIKDTLELPNINIIAKEVNEIDDVNIKDFLAPYRPEKVNIEKVVSRIGETARFATILQETFSGKSDGGKAVLNGVLPSGRTFNQLIEGIPDDKRIDVAKFASRLISNKEDQVNTRETLKALGIRFDIPDINELVPSKLVPINVETLKASLPAGNVLDAVQDTVGNINLNSIASEAKKVNVSLREFLAPYRPEKAINLKELTDKVGKTATISDILRETIRGSADAREVVSRVTPSGRTVEQLIRGIPEGKRIDISQFGSKLIPDSQNKGKQVDTRQALEALGLKFEDPSSGFPATIESIRDRFVPSGNVLGAVKSALGLSNEDPIAAEVSEIDNINIKDLLAPYRPEKTDLKKVISTVGYTATFAEIVKAAFPGQANGKDLLGKVFSGRKTLGQLIDGIPDDKRIDISQFATKLAPKSEEQMDTRQTLEALGVNFENGSVFVDKPITQKDFLVNLQSELRTDFNLHKNLSESTADNTISLSDIASLSESKPTLDSLLDGLRDADGNLPELATREEIFNVAVNGKVSLSRLLSGVLPRNNGVSERAIVNEVGDVQVDLREYGLALLQNKEERVNIFAAAGEIGIETKGLFGNAQYLNDLDSDIVQRIENVTNKIRIGETEYVSNNNETAQSLRGVESRIFVDSNYATVYDSDASYSQINVRGVGTTVHTHTGGFNERNYLTIPGDGFFDGRRVNITEVNISGSDTNLVMQAQDPINSGGHFYEPGEFARYNFFDPKSIRTFLIEGDPSQFSFQKLDNSTVGIFYELDSNRRITVSNSSSVEGSVPVRGGELGFSLGQSTETSVDRPGVRYIPIGSIEGPGAVDLVFGENSIVRFGNNISQ